MGKFKVITMIVVFVIFLCGGTSDANENHDDCSQWMGADFSIGPFKTDARIVSKCDDESFQVLSHDYAKDKNYVYYKPMPNANNMTERLTWWADAKTFKVGPDCFTAWDKRYIFIFGKVISKDHDEFEDLLAYKNSTNERCHMTTK